MRFRAFSLCCAFLTAASTLHPAAQKPGAISPEEVDRSVTAELSRQGIANSRVVSHIDLTGPFATTGQWTFVAAQEGGNSHTDWEDQQPIHVCLVKADNPNCSEKFYKRSGNEDSRFDTPYHLTAARVVFAGQNKSDPLLFLQLCGPEGPNGNCGIATALYRYDKGADHFVRVFLKLTGRNNNENTRFVESGPLQGDVIADVPTEDAPYAYWIEVYRANESGQYAQILRYRSRTHYGDGDPLAVADSEMPDILSHFGLWKPGDPLPVPAHMPKGCTHLYMRAAVEWCK